MPSIDDIAAPFEMVNRDMRIELLLEYADKLPPLPPDYEEMRNAGLNMVHECQSPVFLRPEVRDGTVRVNAYAPREAPTARAFVSILHDAFDGEPPATLLNAPDDLLDRLGLRALLGARRLQGLSAIYQRLRQAVRAHVDQAAPDAS
ncbi:SufE family protein [Salisaeta longa]|uniref:SufE family protein n=1 Tax=Salisaeta longa TaxID=503170 RepID=UPI0003B66E19|nr:SufE family protein [Salisaeta longa]